MKVRFKRLVDGAVVPVRAHATDAGFDLTACSVRFVDGCAVYGTGIAVEIPFGYVGLVFPRSSIAGRDQYLTNSVAVIDSGYRGEIMAKFKPAVSYGKSEEADRVYEVGERIAQLIIISIPDIEFIESDELSDSDRGTGGFGSSGV